MGVFVSIIPPLVHLLAGIAGEVAKAKMEKSRHPEHDNHHPHLALMTGDHLNDPLYQALESDKVRDSCFNEVLELPKTNFGPTFFTIRNLPNACVDALVVNIAENKTIKDLHSFDMLPLSLTSVNITGLDQRNITSLVKALEEAKKDAAPKTEDKPVPEVNNKNGTRNFGEGKPVFL